VYVNMHAHVCLGSVCRFVIQTTTCATCVLGICMQVCHTDHNVCNMCAWDLHAGMSYRPQRVQHVCLGSACRYVIQTTTCASCVLGICMQVYHTDHNVCDMCAWDLHAGMSYRPQRVQPHEARRGHALEQLRGHWARVTHHTRGHTHHSGGKDVFMGRSMARLPIPAAAPSQHMACVSVAESRTHTRTEGDHPQHQCLKQEHVVFRRHTQSNIKGVELSPQGVTLSVQKRWRASPWQSIARPACCVAACDCRPGPGTRPTWCMCKCPEGAWLGGAGTAHALVSSCTRD